jgi:hypothetical protein
VSPPGREKNLERANMEEDSGISLDRKDIGEIKVE